MKIRVALINDLNDLENISEEQFHFENLRPKFNNLIFNNDYVVKGIEIKKAENKEIFKLETKTSCKPVKIILLLYKHI